MTKTCIFFDDLDESVSDKENTFAFIQDALKSFAPTYVSNLKKRKDLPFTEKERDWQRLRDSCFSRCMRSGFGTMEGIVRR